MSKEILIDSPEHPRAGEYGEWLAWGLRPMVEFVRADERNKHHLGCLEVEPLGQVSPHFVFENGYGPMVCSVLERWPRVFTKAPGGSEHLVKELTGIDAYNLAEEGIRSAQIDDLWRYCGEVVRELHRESELLRIGPRARVSAPDIIPRVPDLGLVPVTIERARELSKQNPRWVGGEPIESQSAFRERLGEGYVARRPGAVIYPLVGGGDNE